MAVQKKLSIVIPCFNEPDNVSLLLARFVELVKRIEYPIEIIMVDGCSTDKTPEILTKLFKKLDSSIFKLILMTERKGYGHDIMHGLSQASGDVLAWTHADMQTDPQDVLKAFDIFNAEKNMLTFIKGRRKNRALLDVLFTLGMQVVTFFLLRMYLDDINAQPKLFSKKFFDQYLKGNAPEDFSLDLYALYQAKSHGYQIMDFPVYFAKRLHGEAKGGGGSWKNRLNLMKRTFKYIWKMRAGIS